MLTERHERAWVRARELLEPLKGHLAFESDAMEHGDSWGAGLVRAALEGTWGVLTCDGEVVRAWGPVPIAVAGRYAGKWNWEGEESLTPLYHEGGMQKDHP